MRDFVTASRDLSWRRSALKAVLAGTPLALTPWNESPERFVFRSLGFQVLEVYRTRGINVELSCPTKSHWECLLHCDANVIICALD